MKDTNRSLLIAILAFVAMGLFAKSPQFSGGQSWISGLLTFATLGLSVWGFGVGLRGAKQQRTAWSWLAPAINVLIFITMILFWGLLLMAWEDFE